MFHVIPETTMIPQIEVVELYGFHNFLADIGGYLGLLLGASILSIISDSWDWVSKGLTWKKERKLQTI